MSVGIEKLLNAKTESEFFVTMCRVLESYQRPGIKCSSELVVGSDLQRPSLEVAFYMVLGRQTGGEVGYTRRKVWTFTLYADGELCWEVNHFNIVGPDTYSSSEHTVTTGLEAIKRVLRETKGMFVAGELRDGAAVG